MSYSAFPISNKKLYEPEKQEKLIKDFDKILKNKIENDEYEFPVKYNLVGAKGVGRYMGMSESKVRKCLFQKAWAGKYKAIDTGRRKKAECRKVWDKRYRMKGAVG